MSTENNLFVTAAIKKYRFDTSRGQALTEDLFELNLESLDKIAVNLDEQIQKAGKKSFIGKRLDSTGELENKLEIVKFVIEYKQEKAEAAKNRAAKAEQKAFLLDLKRRKEVAALENLSTEEIDKQLAALGE